MRLNKLSIHILPVTLISFLALAVSANCFGQDLELSQAIKSIQQIQPRGLGHDQATKAIKILNNASVDQVPQMLQGMDGANKLALNWLRGGIQSALAKGGELPRAEIQAYFDDKSKSQMGRLMAFELLTEGNDQVAAKMTPAMIDDPSLPLRAMAVNAFIEKAKSTADADSIGTLGFALTRARDVNQVQKIAELLNERGVEVNLQKQLGFVPTWHIAGPFDNTGEKGFDTAYGPEKNPADIDLEAKYSDGKAGKTIEWIQHNTVDSSCFVDVNTILGEMKGALIYAYAEFEAEKDQLVDIRIGCINGNKVWVNGHEVINNEIYHVGMMTDQFTGQANLKKGTNKILYKVCQNEQTQPWANQWMFNLRICEADGKAVAPAKPKSPSQ